MPFLHVVRFRSRPYEAWSGAVPFPSTLLRVVLELPKACSAATINSLLAALSRHQPLKGLLLTSFWGLSTIDELVSFARLQVLPSLNKLQDSVRSNETLWPTHLARCIASDGSCARSRSCIA